MNITLEMHETEAGFTMAVIALAKLHGWRTAHFRPARTKDGGWRTAVSGDGAGFPDLILVRGTRIIAAELKVGKGKLTQAQSDWLSDLGRVPGMTTCVWRPADWCEIVEWLSA